MYIAITSYDMVNPIAFESIHGISARRVSPTTLLYVRISGYDGVVGEALSAEILMAKLKAVGCVRTGRGVWMALGSFGSDNFSFRHDGVIFTMQYVKI